MNQKLKAVTIFLTGLWVLLILIIACMRSGDLSMMTLNAWGDFLAGVAAPLALLWLVTGYFQHGEELRLSRKALKLQQQELHQQVQEIALLAKHSARQADAAEANVKLTEREQAQDESQRAQEARPQLVCDGHGSNPKGGFNIKLKNRGGEIHDVRCKYEGEHTLKLNGDPISIWESGESRTLHLSEKRISNAQVMPIEYPLKFLIEATDTLGQRHTMQFSFPSDDWARMELLPH